MSQPPDFEARLSGPETQDAAAARVLAGGADHDVEQIRGEIHDFRQATTSSFHAIREDLTNLSARVDNGFAKVDRGFAGVCARLDGTAAGIEQITGLLNALISQQGGQQEG